MLAKSLADDRLQHLSACVGSRGHVPCTADFDRNKATDRFKDKLSTAITLRMFVCVCTCVCCVCLHDCIMGM